MINGIHHVALVARDFERMVRFYVEGVGFEIVFRGEWQDSEVSERVLGIAGSEGRMVVLKAGNAYLEIHQYLKPEGTPLGEQNRPCDQGYRHICLDVTNIDQEYERLMKAGMQFKWPPQRYDDAGVCAVYARDPEGNIVEIQEVISNRAPFALSSLGSKILPRT